MKLLVQPGDGVEAITRAIDRARRSVQIMIFRFDQKAVEQALTRAAERGVFVHALIAFTNRGGERSLRALEQRLLRRGITVAQTADDLIRYHGKFLIVDGRELFLLAFNFTHLDIERSRSFGVVTSEAKLVAEASRLFECDVKRLPYRAGCNRFVVSPVNARAALSRSLARARKELLIYDPEVSDPSLLRILEERATAGVRICIIGGVGDRKSSLPWRRLNGMRLHTRAILCDGKSAFIGSQSLRKLELDARREVGIIFASSSIVAEMRKVFEQDWAAAKPPKSAKQAARIPVKKTAKRVAKAITRKLAVKPVVSQVVDVLRRDAALDVPPHEVEETVKQALKDALKDAVHDAAKKVVKSAVEQEL
ncbi:MAG: phosphatidylserine synthase [Acidobacteria bacterium]|nr:phosphatidylserine synthase [Acidobacteriota bacterium]